MVTFLAREVKRLALARWDAGRGRALFTERVVVVAFDDGAVRVGDRSDRATLSMW
jgi:hypothetical protein